MPLFRPWMVCGALSEHVDIDGEIARRGVDAAVAKQLLNGTQVAAVVEKVCGHSGAQQVRVCSLPRSLPADALEAFISTGETERIPGVEVNTSPDAPCGAVRSAKVCDKQSVGLPWARLSADTQPAIKQAFHFFTKRDDAVITAFTVYDAQGSVCLDGADLQLDKLTGTEAGFVQQTHHDVVPVAYERGQVWRCQQLAYLPFRKCPGNALRRSGGLRKMYGNVRFRVSKEQSPSVEGADSRQFCIEGRNADTATPVPHPAFNGGLTW